MPRNAYPPLEESLQTLWSHSETFDAWGVGKFNSPLPFDADLIGDLWGFQGEQCTLPYADRMTFLHGMRMVSALSTRFTPLHHETRIEARRVTLTGVSEHKVPPQLAIVMQRSRQQRMIGCRVLARLPINYGNASAQPEYQAVDMSSYPFVEDCRPVRPEWRQAMGWASVQHLAEAASALILRTL